MYTALSDDTVGHLWANKLSIIYRVIKLYHYTSAFVLAICLRSPSVSNYVLYILSLYVWHVNCCYEMSHCLCIGLVKLIVIVQAQHINNTKYSNSYTINDDCRQLYRFCDVSEMRSQFLMSVDMRFLYYVI